MDEKDATFLARWSRLKRGQGVTAMPPPPHDGTPAPEHTPETQGGTEPSGTDRSDEPVGLSLEEIERIDLDTLDAGADYTPFMQANVPPELRGKALARLWTSDPVLSQPDPFFEYGGDYTDAAVGVASGMIQTAYKVGQGFLSDEEAAAWDRLGKDPLPLAPAGIVIAVETPDQPAVRAFLAESEAYMAALYPAESNHFVDVAALMAPGVVFLVARRGVAAGEGEGEALGCGALLPDDAGSAEIKRMWVTPAARGLKVGRAILDRLEAVARERKIRVLRLETGVSQPEAIGLYRAAGYVERAAFEPYQPDPLSLFMEKPIG